jgi:hypothetical protein
MTGFEVPSGMHGPFRIRFGIYILVGLIAFGALDFAIYDSASTNGGHHIEVMSFAEMPGLVGRNQPFQGPRRNAGALFEGDDDGPGAAHVVASDPAANV